MMTAEQRYLFDITGYLHIEGAVTGQKLKIVQITTIQNKIQHASHDS